VVSLKKKPGTVARVQKQLRLRATRDLPLRKFLECFKQCHGGVDEHRQTTNSQDDNDDLLEALDAVDLEPLSLIVCASGGA
jgi:hypothetical protein